MRKGVSTLIVTAHINYCKRDVCSTEEQIFSRIFDKSARFKIVQKLAKLFLSVPGFLRIGVITAVNAL